MNNITILSSASCSYCVAAKNLLHSKGLDYQEIDLHSGGQQAQDLLIRSGQRTVPQIFIDQQPIGGFTELSALINKQSLQ